MLFSCAGRLRAEELDQLRDDEQIACVAEDGWLPPGTHIAGWVDHIHAEGCAVLATLVGGFEDGRPLLTRKAHGAGAFWYVAGGLDHAARSHLLGRIEAESGIQPCLRGLPPGVIARERLQPERRYIFLASYGAASTEIALSPGWSDAVSGAPLTHLQLAPWDARVICTAR